jgi:hypothetical protein
MTKIRILIAFGLINFICINSALCQEKENELSFKAIFKGGYSNFHRENDSNYYYLVDLLLINNTDSICDFMTYSCASLINVVIDHKEYDFLFHNCASNFAKRVLLKPKQEFILPVILFRNKHSDLSNDQLKFGFILLTSRNTLSQEESVIQLLLRMRERHENIIWSTPITMETTSFLPFEILDVINDTTFSKTRNH